MLLHVFTGFHADFAGRYIIKFNPPGSSMARHFESWMIWHGFDL